MSDFVLGFDASCGKCSGVARQLEQDIGDRVAVMPLASPQMKKWREAALGASAPWAPTLVQHDPDGVKAWVGWQIAPVLSRRLGAKDTWTVLNRLGAEAFKHESSPPRVAAFVSRASFLRGAMGAVVGLGMLGVTGPKAFANTSLGKSARPEMESLEDLSGSSLDEAAEKFLASADAQNIGEMSSLVPTAAAGVTLASMPRSALRVAGTAADSSSDSQVHLHGSRAVLAGGVSRTMVSVYSEETQTLLVFAENSEPVDGRRSWAQRHHLDLSDLDAPVVTPIAYSFEGKEPEDVSPTVLSTGANPCNAPTCCSEGPGSQNDKQLASVCKRTPGQGWDCIQASGTCALCAASATGGPFGIAAAIACAILNCPDAWTACCPSEEIKCTSCACPT